MKRSITLCLAAVLAIAFEASADEQTGAADKPFAEAHVVLQAAEADAESQGRVLSVANNLIRHYGGPDFVDIEIVAYGPGISLLFPDSPANDRVMSLLANGVRFVGCMNTVETLTRQTGKEPELIAETIPVQTGVAHLIERATAGFVVIRP